MKSSGWALSSKLVSLEEDIGMQKEDHSREEYLQARGQTSQEKQPVSNAFPLVKPHSGLLEALEYSGLLRQRANPATNQGTKPFKGVPVPI